MAEIKTKQTEESVHDFILAFTHTDQRRKDSFDILKFMQEVTGYEPKMWGPSIIGFGKYHYKSDRSRQEGDWPMIGFSPRKAAISLYVYCGCSGQDDLLRQLGKYTMGKACIYIKKFSDIDHEILRQLMLSSMDYLKKKYTT